MRFRRHRTPLVVRRLDVRPGDTVVITVPEHLTAQQAAFIKHAFHQVHPLTPAIVLEGGAGIAVLRPVPIPDEETS